MNKLKTYWNGTAWVPSMYQNVDAARRAWQAESARETQEIPSESEQVAWDKFQAAAATVARTEARDAREEDEAHAPQT